MRIPIILAAAVVCCTGFTTNLFSAEDRPKLDADTISRLVRALDDADFQVRRQATQQLADGGAEVIESLSAAVTTGSLERRYRALDVLGKIYSRGQPDTFDTVEHVLDQIKQSPNASLATTAQTVLDVNYETRQRFALAEIRRLGGSVLRDSTNEVLAPGDADPAAEPRPEIITSIVLNQDWTGGDAGLWHIKRLTRLLSLYRVKSAKVSDEAIEDLRQSGLNVQDRGPACLGIRATEFGQGDHVKISSITPNSAAAKAGLRPEDAITHFDDTAITDFKQLIDLISTKLPGDKVPVALVRDGSPMTLTVELLPWPKER